MSLGVLTATSFTHLDDSIYNNRKMKAPYEDRLRGNTWVGAGEKAKMPELDGEVMQKAFEECGNLMSQCMGEIWGLYEHGSPNLAMNIFEYYTHGGGTNDRNHNDFKLPFPTGDSVRRKQVHQCGEKITGILRLAMKTAGSLACYDEQFLGYLRWQAGYVQDGSHPKDGTANKDVQEQEEKVVCWQLTLGEEFHYVQPRWIDGSHTMGGCDRRYANIEIAVGIYFKQTFGRYSSLTNGSLLSTACLCAHSRESIGLSGVSTIMIDSGNGTLEVPATTYSTEESFDPFEGSSVPANHLINGLDRSVSPKGTITVSEGPPTYRTTELTYPPSYHTNPRSRFRQRFGLG